VRSEKWAVYPVGLNGWRGLVFPELGWGVCVFVGLLVALEEGLPPLPAVALFDDLD
jgi:hypothetical protein